MEQANLKELVMKVYSLQEERVQIYRTFEEGFKTYLNGTTKFTDYRQLAHEVTEKFNKVSQGIRDIEDTMNSTGNKTLTGLVRRLQQEEKNKLELTAKIQLALQETLRKEEHSDVKNLKNSLQKIVETINEILEELRYESEDILLQDEKLDED